MNRIELAKGVYYVGAVDWNVRDFHGYGTPRGVTYNAYLIVDEKICLIDTVKAPFADELLERIGELVDPADIDYVVVNHVEPDHSGALPAVMARATRAKVVVTSAGGNEVMKHYPMKRDFMVVKEGDTLSLGRCTLRFIPLPMLHWPDSMATYLEEEAILFSNDAFGQHLCTTKRFDDENDLHDVLYEAEKYYANILQPFGRLMAKALPKISALPLKMIAPSHGVAWRAHIGAILDKYRDWSAGRTRDKVLVVYDSMWGATEKMARRILEGVASAGAEGRLYRLPVSDRSEIMRDLLEARGVIVGSPTQNNGPLPTVGALLTYFKGLKPAGKIGASFGAYGWAGAATQAIDEGLAAAGIEVAENLVLKWTPDGDELKACFDFGVSFGRRALER